MSKLISLSVHCPVCGESFMDESQLVDNCPSILLKVMTDKEEGKLRISSVWDSFNYLCDIEIPRGSIVNMACTHCNSDITSKLRCDNCDAPMISYDLDHGGKLDICSRAGCKNHFVKLVDFSFALKNLFNESDLYGATYYDRMTLSDHSFEGDSEDDEAVEIMKTGSFLHTFCPHCKKTLIKDGTIKFKVDREGETGFLELSPYLNVFTSRSTIFLKEGENIGNIKCFHCDKSLEDKDHRCQECKSDVFRVEICARTKLIDFYICSKKGCRWHGLSKEDLKEIKLEDSLEW